MEKKQNFFDRKFFFRRLSLIKQKIKRLEFSPCITLHNKSYSYVYIEKKNILNSKFFFLSSVFYLLFFLICWLPFTISYPTSIIYPNKFPNILQCIVFWFGYVNSLLNPFLYVYSSRNFRQAIIETLCCHVRLRSRQRLRYQWSFRAAQK
ncbi:unnamed protein product [Rotaria sp. Silwood1]|nr:unnamed protein product [Rotaria sp. Silwood1]